MAVGFNSFLDFIGYPIGVSTISINDNLNLFINGFNTNSNNIDLSIRGSIFIDNDLTLFVSGPISINENIDLFISGFIPSIFDNVTLIIKGSSPPPQISCPTLDPNASIQISDDLIQIYQDRIDSLINQLGKNVLLEFDPIIEPCPNCLFDIVENRSTGIYRVGGPISFSRGQKCSYCKGQGFLERKVEKCIKCLIKWNPKELKNYGISVQKNSGAVRLKAFLTDAPDIVKAKTAIVDYDIEKIFKLRVRLIKGPTPVGLREDRYCVSFWELLDI